jgi:hypothetical protein
MMSWNLNASRISSLFFHATLKHCPFSSGSNDLFHTPLNLQADLILDVLELFADE